MILKNLRRTRALSGVFMTLGVLMLPAPSLATSAVSVSHLDAKLSYKLKTMLDYSPNDGNSSTQDNANEAASKVLTAGMELSELLRASANRSVLLSAKLPRARKAGLVVVTSPDGKLRFFSWDIMTTGTGHPHEAVALWAGPVGGSHYFTNEGNDVGCCDEIRCLRTKNGKTYYLVVSSVAQSSTRVAKNLIVYEIVGSKLIPRNVFRTQKGATAELFCDQPVTSAVEGDLPSPVTVQQGGLVLKIPRIDDNSSFTGAFYRYAFNGTFFVKNL